jgi:hypothetical protein
MILKKGFRCFIFVALYFTTVTTSPATKNHDADNASARPVGYRYKRTGYEFDLAEQDPVTQNPPW